LDGGERNKRNQMRIDRLKIGFKRKKTSCKSDREREKAAAFCPNSLYIYAI